MKTSIGILSLVLLAGCGSLHHPYIWQDESIKLESFTTFSWITDHPLGFHQIQTNTDYDLEDILKSQTISLLEEKGMRFVSGRTVADVNISFAVGAKTRSVVPIRQFPPAISGDETDTSLTHYPDLGYDYLEGQLCIEFHDPLTNQPLWHGTIDDVLLPDKDAFNRELVTQILTIILSKYKTSSNELKE